MKQKLLLILFIFCSLLLQQNVKAQTLAAGDIAFIGMNIDNPDSFSFICLKALPAGETLYFTDHGWENTQWAPGVTTEAHMSWVIPSGITCGTIVNVSYNGTSFTLTGAGGTYTLLSGTFQFLGAGDQILAYQSTSGAQPANPTFIAGINMEYAVGNMDATTGWNINVINNASASTLPPGLTNGVNCLALYTAATSSEPDNAKYNGTLTGTASAVRTAVNTLSNWIFDDVTPYTITPAGFTAPNVSCSATVSASTASLSGFTACFGTNSANQTFTVSGNALSNDITVTAPTGFEVSLSSGSGFASSVAIVPTSGSATNVTVYVRTTTGATGTPSGNITLSSSPATSVNVSVSGSVTAIPNVTTHPTGKTVCAGSNTTFSVTASNSPNYQWQVNTSGSGFSDITNGGVYSGATTSVLTITGVTSGMNTYQYRARLINGSCTDNSNSATLTVPTALGSSVSSQTNVSTYGGNNGSATVAGSGGTAPYFYSWSPSGVTTATATGLSAGTYTVTITDSTPNGSGGCSKTQTVTITQPAGVSTSVSSLSTFTTCTGTPSAAQSFTVSGDSGLTANVVVTAPTGYEVSLSSGSGYAGSISITQSGGTIATTTIYARLTSSATGTPAGNITVASTGVTTKNVAVTGTVSAITFTTHPSDSAICPSGNTTFTGAATNATGYQWKVSSDGGTIYNPISNTAPYSGATTATLTVTGAIAGMNGYKYKLDATGTCPTATSNAATLTISSSPSVTANPPNRTICSGNNTTFTVTATGATGYQWQVSTDSGNSYNDISNGAPYSGVTTSTLTVTGATSAITGYRYRCTVSSGCGSTNSNGGTLTVITIAIAQSQTNVTTYGGSNGTATATPSGGIPTYTYTWSAPSGATTATATGLTAGTYTVTVSDALSCSSTSANYVITQPAGVATSVSTLVAFGTCSGTASANKTFTVNGGSGLTADVVVTAPTGYEVSLSSGSGFGSSVTITQSGGAIATTTIYVRMAASASGSMSGNVTVSSTGVTTKNVTVTGLASDLTASSYTVTNVSCFGGSNGAIDLTPAGGQISYTYNWGGASTQDRTSIPAGTYSVTITDGNGCVYTISNIVVGQPTAALSAATGGGKTDVSCFGGNNGTATVAPTGGTPSYSYSWNTTPVQTTATATGLIAGTYTVTVTDANGCQATRLFTINQPADLVATAGAQTNLLCNGGTNGSATVSVTGGTGAYTYLWAPSGGTAATATGLAAGTYTVTVKDANLCQTAQSFTITQPAALVATAGAQSNTSCNGGANGSATVSVTGGTGAYTYLWAPSGGTAATASGLSAGTYTVTVKDANLCQTTQSFTITEPAALVATAGAQTNISCNGGTNGSATVSVTGGTGTYTYLWAPSGGTAATASGLAAGTYTVTVKDANLCQTAQSFTITQPALLTATISKTDVLCNGGSTGTATVAVSGGTTSYTYLWSPSGGTGATASGLAVGNYSCLITDANGCSNTQNITINQPSLLGATTSQINATCSTGGQASVTPFGGVGSYTYLWSPGGQTTQLVTGLSAGNYSCLITDGNGCIVTKNFVITSTNTLVASTFQTNLLCNGSNTGSAGVIPSGAPGPYTYVWSPSGGNADTAINLAAGTYSVLITSSNGCSITKSFTITQPAALVATAGAQTNTSCNGGANGSATVSVTGGTGAYTYLWAPSGGTAATASGLAAGTYTVTVKDANLCQTTQSFTITQPAALVATAGAQTNILCNGGTNGSATVSVTGGTGAYTYLWAPSGGTAATASGLAAGTYTVTVKDANLCQTTQSFTITQPAALVATAGAQTNVLCNSGATGSATVSVTGGTGAYTYLWAPSGGTAATASGLAAGTYTVTVKDANLCQTTQSFTITQPAALVATAGAQSNTSCNGGTNGSATVSVTGGTGAYTYLWAPSGGTAATATGLTAGTYTVTVKDANLCQTTQSFTITQPAALVATAGAQTNILCNGGTNGSATVSVTGGTGAYTYLWAPSGGTAATASGLAAGTYTVTVKDANLCQTTQSFTITQPAALVATAGAQTNILCNGGTNGSATVSVTGGTGAYTYLWAPSGGTAATASGLAAGTYTVTVKDANLCQTTQSFTITQPAALVATAGAQTNVLCNGGATGSATVSVTGGTGAYTYLWAPTGGTSATASGLAAGTYTVTVKDANLCQTTQSFTITQPAALVATVGAQTNLLCNGATNGSATVSVTGGTGAYTYLWAPTGGTAATATGLGAGTYTVTVKDANLCQTTQSFTITAPVAITATTSQTNILCFGANTGTATVSGVTGGTGAYTYAWLPSGGTAATATGLAAGNYTCTITDGNGCTLVKTFTITQLPAVTVNGSSTNITCNGASTGTINLSVIGGTGPYTYVWSPAVSTGTSATGLAAGTYVVTATDANGCTGTRTFNILQPTAMVITSTHTDLLCNGATTASATVTVTGGVAPYNYAWSPSGGNTATKTGLAAGTYTCTVTDGLGCSATHTIAITEPDALAVATSQTNVSCYNENDGSLGVTVSGGTLPYIYTWTPAVSTTATATGLIAGNYSVTITDANGCSTLRNFSVSQPLPLAVTITKTDVGCFGNNDGTAAAVISGGTAPYSFEWTAPGGGTPDPQNLVAGTYTFTITDDHGCTLTESITINQPLQVVINNQPQNAAIAFGQNAVYTVNATNATAYQWQVSEDGTNWSNITNGGTNPTYSGATTSTLIVANAPSGHNGYSYRALLLYGQGCTVASNAALLIIESIINAVDDDFSTNVLLPATGGIAGDVTLNDLINNIAVNDEDIVISVIDNDGLFGVTIDADGNIIVPVATAEGTYTITYSICEQADLTNCSTAEAVVVVSEISGTDMFKNISLTLYPNPATTKVFIETANFSSHNNMKVTINDLNGRVVRENRINSELEGIDVTGMESGVYIFTITSDSGRVTKRVIIDKKP